MSADTRPGSTPEVPSGNELVRRTATLANQALTDAYPILASSPYNKRLINPNQIEFTSLEQMQAMERKDKPTDASVLYQALSLCGVPREALDSHWFRVSENGQDYYQTSYDAPLYIAEGVFNLSSPSPAMRSVVAVALGDSLIQHALRNIPTQVMPPSNLWRERMKVHVRDTFMLGVAHEFAGVVDEQKLESAQRMMDSLFDADIRIIVRGASVYVLLEGQTMTTFEYMAGRKLGEGIAEILSHSPQIKMRTLLRQTGIIGKEGYSTPRYRNAQYAEDVRRAISSAKLKSESQLLFAYLNSEIPELYRTSQKKGVIDPEKYAS